MWVWVTGTVSKDATERSGSMDGSHLRGDEGRGHQLLAQPQLLHVRHSELLCVRVVRPVPDVVVDGRQLDGIGRLTQVVAALHVVDGLRG